MIQRRGKYSGTSDPEHYDAIKVACRYIYEIPVENGAAYFDEHVPGWAFLVDLDTFNMRYTSADILAQVYKMDARSTREYRQWAARSLLAHGMYYTSGEPRGYDSLTVAWRKVINERRGGKE